MQHSSLCFRKSATGLCPETEASSAYLYVLFKMHLSIILSLLLDLPSAVFLSGFPTYFASLSFLPLVFSIILYCILFCIKFWKPVLLLNYP